MSDRRLDPRPREPFGPRQPGLRGWLLRMAQWGLTLTVVVCIYPGIMLVFTAVTDLLPAGGSWQMPPPGRLRIHGVWCLWTTLLVLTGLRVSGDWYRCWMFYPVAAAFGVLLSQSIPDASDPLGQWIALLMACVALLQCMLHALWSLCVWRNRISQKEE